MSKILCNFKFYNDAEGEAAYLISLAYLGFTTISCLRKNEFYKMYGDQSENAKNIVSEFAKEKKVSILEDMYYYVEYAFEPMEISAFYNFLEIEFMNLYDIVHNSVLDALNKLRHTLLKMIIGSDEKVNLKGVPNCL